MPITQAQIVAAQAIQHAAAHDPSQHIRLLAGPGTGKSASIEERVHWLLDNGVAANSIVAVSFTRASAQDLEHRIRSYGASRGHASIDQVYVGTLHSLALKVLRRAGLLTAFPVEPKVLDNWELEEIFDAEFGNKTGITRKTRLKDIRRQHEAFWSTGTWDPANYTPPIPPITPQERIQFSSFLSSRGQVYSCVLPGELIRKCVDAANAGILDIAELLGASHLIVDEYQDLNPCDLEFIDIVARTGVVLFVAGDDDQSIYSFRFASPAGIQQFHTKYRTAGVHSLSACFRCAPRVLHSAYSLIQGFPDPSRLPKALASLYAASTPPLAGIVHNWRFQSSQTEAAAIAESCRDLIAAGVRADSIMILLSSVPTLGRPISDALTANGVPFEELRPDLFCDTKAGRLGLSILRIISNPDDYVALRSILCLRAGVGIGTCNAIAEIIHTNNLNFKDALSSQLPHGLFSGRTLTALNAARVTMTALHGWQDADLFGFRRQRIKEIIADALGQNEGDAWSVETDLLPDAMTLAEVRPYVSASSESERHEILANVNTRLGIEQENVEPSVPRVRLMTMHSAKGLSAQVVFIPGLEEPLLPGAKRSPYPGLVSEAARLLFVSITRARLACILSFANFRMAQGQMMRNPPSRFTSHMGTPFVQRQTGFTGVEVDDIATSILHL